jgi:GTP-binding protein
VVVSLAAVDSACKLTLPMKITSAVFEISAPTLESCPEAEVPEFALIGRSNVGKSSLLNMLTGQSHLAKVSSTPGHTKLINFFRMNQTWRLVDLPGYGFARTGAAERTRFNDAVANYLSFRFRLNRVFILIDSRLEPQEIDLSFIEWLNGVGRPFAFIFTKSDKVKPNQMKRAMDSFKAAVEALNVAWPPVFASSSKTRDGQMDILKFIQSQLAI